MGCDIHICIQVKDPDGWREIMYQRPFYQFEEDESKKTRPKLVEHIPVSPMNFRGRDYDLFGILAGVRTEGSWPVIAEGRGWPEGFDEKTPGIDPFYLQNPQYQEESDDAGNHMYMGDHSYTWVTLEELKAYDWDGIRKKRGSQEYYNDNIEQTAREATGDWPGQVIPWLEELAEGRELRLVLGFDS